MKRFGIFWSFLALMLLGALSNIVPHGSAQEQTQAPQSIAGVRERLTGTSGTTTQAAVINFAALAAEQKQLSSTRPEEHREKKIDKPKPGPRNRQVPADALTSGTDFSSDTESNAVNSLSETPTSRSPAAASSFKALEDNDTTIPSDTHGAVGPNHLMVTLNSQVRIQTRTGSTISTVSLEGFWSRLGVGIVFDPKVLYDPYNERWMFTAIAEPEASNSSLLIGVSQTSDPTGNWKLYKVDADSTNQTWADYPSIGFNKNWIVVSVNMFGVSDNRYTREHIYAFNKTNLYAFGATASHKMFQVGRAFTSTPAITYDNTLSTMYLVEEYNGNAAGKGVLRISSITGNVGSEVLNTGTAFPSSSPWEWGVDADFAPQLGSTKKIQNNDSRMQNTVYRNGSLWATHTVFLPAGGPTRTAVQWWELTPAGVVKQRGRIDDPTGQKFYAFPSIAVNKNSDVLIGYSSFSSQQYASASYSFRKATDPVNTMQSSYIVKRGESPYYKTFSGAQNRWGDYSATVVDPANDLDMWVIQEYAAMPAGDYMWGTWWGRVSLGPSTPPPPATTYSVSGRVTVGTANPTGLGQVTVKLTGSKTLTATTDASGNYSFPNLPAGGNYTVTPSNLSWQFAPVNMTFNNLSANQAAANFEASAKKYTISGRITAGTTGLSGVSVTISGSRAMTILTDSLGKFSFTNLPKTGNYNVTPSKAGYKFTPVSRTYTNLSANQTTANFSAVQQLFSISGRVMFGTSGLGGVTVKLTGARTLTATTTSLGGYKFASLPAGANYTVTASKTGFTINPANINFTPLSGNQTTANFTATQP